MNFMDSAIVRYPVYFGFAVLTFAISMALTFPDDQIRDIVSVQMEKALGNKYKVTIADLDVWWLTGVSLEGVTIEERVSPDDQPQEPAPEEEGLPADLPMKVTIERVAGRLAILSSIVSGPTVNFEADVGGGLISGQFQQGDEGREIFVDFDALDLRKTTALTALLGVPVFGELDGEVRFVLDPKRPQIIDGEVALEGEKITVGPATVKTDKFPPITYLEIPQTNFGGITIEMTVENEKKGAPQLTFSDVQWAGRDIRGEVWGDIALSRNMATSRSDLKMRLQLDEGFVRKNSLGPLLNVAEVRKGKNKDWFGFRLYGPLSRLQFKGHPNAATGAKAAAGGEDEDEAPAKKPRRPKRN